MMKKSIRCVCLFSVVSVAMLGFGCIREVDVAAPWTLHLLVAAGKADEVRDYLALHPDQVNDMDSEGRSCLMRAVESFNPQMVKLLLDLGADPMQQSSTAYSPKREIPLGIAVMMNHYDLVVSLGPIECSACEYTLEQFDEFIEIAEMNKKDKTFKILPLLREWRDRSLP